MSWTEELELDLEETQSKGLRRSLRVCAHPEGPRIRLDGRELVQFASNNYLGLSAHPQVLAAAKAALDEYGAGAGASRLVGGGSLMIHAALERELARFKGMPSALVFATGSLANLGLLGTLAGPEDVVVLDKACHATLYDGARLSGAGLARFPHQDLARLDALLAEKSKGARRTIVVVEGVYSMDGDIAPLPELLELTARHRALLVVDEAHSTGVLGAGGHGILEHYGLAAPENLILSGTLSKALGSLGGYVAGPQVLVDTLVNHSRAFIYATALPASCAAAALEALRLIEKEPGHLQRLRVVRKALAEGLTGLGWDFGRSQSPILPILVGRAAAALALEQRLLGQGFYVPAMRPPTVPAAACRLRLSVGAAHDLGQVEALLAVLGKKP
ncbi:MAG TPA: 8-amino-7-oxononanoate synthase [bacterium]|nr:8-amino-7-oxononanoate synthase [bacterium]